jgi:uncharacterized protein (TIGR02453 family)
MTDAAEVHSLGFPGEAFAYFEGLRADNSKEYFRRHREVYEHAVHQPMLTLAAALSQEFGNIKVLRPQRDTRVSNDKSPYKAYEGAYVDIAHSLGFWVHLDVRGLYASGRFYPHAVAKLTRYRAAVDDDTSGTRLAALTTELRAGGFTIEGDRLKTGPRGFPVDHPRLDLLCHRTLDVGRTFSRRPGADLQDITSAVRETWRTVRPLLDWFADTSIC